MEKKKKNITATATAANIVGIQQMECTQPIGRLQRRYKTENE